MCKKLLLVIFTLLCLSSLSGCDIINAIRLVNMNSDIQPTSNLTKRIKLKSVFLGEKPYVYANVNGKELLFLLDTGSPIFVLHDTELVKSMNLEEGFQVAFGGWGEEEDSVAYQTELREVSFGGVNFKNVNAAVMPVSKTPYFLHEEEVIYDGIIGHDLMHHFTWEFDAENNEIFISNKAYMPQPGTEVLELVESFSKISVQGELSFNDSYSAINEFQIDTGSRHYIKLSATYVKNKEIDIRSPKVTAADFGLKGKVEHQRVNLPSLKLGQTSIKNVKANLIPGKDEDEGWIIGNALLNQFKTVIDYKNGKLYLEPKSTFVTDYNLIGLELRKIKSGNFIVRYVFPQMPVVDSDVKVGDIVTSINGMASKNIPLSAYTDISSKVGANTLCIERKNQCFVVKSKHIKGYSQAH